MHHLQSQLSPAIRDHYNVTGIDILRFNQTPWGDINLATMSLEKAQALVKQGFPYLVPKGTKQPADRLAQKPREEPDKPTLNAKEVAALISGAETEEAAWEIARQHPEKMDTKTVRDALAKWDAPTEEENASDEEE